MEIIHALQGNDNKKVKFFFPSFEAEPQSKDETLKIKWQHSSSKQRLYKLKVGDFVTKALTLSAEIHAATFKETETCGPDRSKF